MMVPFFIAGFYKYRNKEIHVHVLAKEKNNAQNHINIKHFYCIRMKKITGNSTILNLPKNIQMSQKSSFLDIPSPPLAYV